MLAMLESLVQERSDREIWWLHGARNSGEQSFAAEASTLLAALPNVRTHVYYSRPGPDDLEGRDFDSAGHLDAAVLASLGLPSDAEAYICGPAAFMDDIGAGLATPRSRTLAHPHRTLRPRSELDARDCRNTDAGAPPACRRSRNWADHHLRPQRPCDPVASRLWQLACTSRVL